MRNLAPTDGKIRQSVNLYFAQWKPTFFTCINYVNNRAFKWINTNLLKLWDLYCEYRSKSFSYFDCEQDTNVTLHNCSFHNNSAGFYRPEKVRGIEETFQVCYIMHKVLFGIQFTLDSVVNLFICITKLSNALQVSGDEVRIHSKCCKGVISFVGKGGAIRVQRGILNMTSSTFTNNTARLLGTVGLPQSCLRLFRFPFFM